MTRKRFVVHSRRDVPLFDLDVNAMAGEGAVRTERLKGEHKLDVTTTQELDEGMRILSRDGTLRWREWVVDEPQDTHDGDGMLREYGCTWSMQYDLATVAGGEQWPGTYVPVTAGEALATVLGVQSRWEVGYVTVAGTAGTSLYDGSVWEYLGELQDVWGGEMEPRVEVGADGAVHRYVDWLAHVGRTEATRRFDFGEDCTSIVRKVAPGPRYCWIEPRGGRDAQDADGIRYSARCGVEEEPLRQEGDFIHYAGSKYVRDTVAEQLFRVPDGRGGWHYPTKVVCYDLDLDGDQEELLDKAMADVASHTRPKATYEADVLQFAEAGLDPHGVQLGDEVQIVDRAFGGEPLRLQARVVEAKVNELDETDASLVIGEPNADLASSFKSLSGAIEATEGRVRHVESDATIVRIETLLEQINAEINGTGGYGYLVDGEGIVTYDRAVEDPLVGVEAAQVVQMKGGTIRFAKEKKPGFAGINDWKWTNVITPEGYIGLAAAIGAITSGYIGSASGGNYWNLDTGEFRMASTSMVGDQTLAEYIGDNLGLTQTEVFNLLTNNGALQGLYMSGGQLYVNASYINTGVLNASLITAGTLSANRINGGTLKLGGQNNGNGILQVYDSSGNLIGTWNNSGISATGNLRMVSRGISSSAKSFADIGQFTWTGWIYGTKVTSGRTVYGLRLHTEGEGTDGDLIITSKAQTGSTTLSYGASAILSKGPLCLSAAAGEIDDNPHINIGGDTGSPQTITMRSGAPADMLHQIEVSDGGITLRGRANYLLTAKATNYVGNHGEVRVGVDFAVNGSKSRIAETDSYGERMLYCYESPQPLFGDVGGGVIGDDGTCVVSIDDMFSESVRCDLEYHVFLQPYGDGRAWVSERTPTHFVVRGTPGLGFAWEMKARQVGYEHTRMEDHSVVEWMGREGSYGSGIESLYGDDLNYIGIVESLYEEES